MSDDSFGDGRVNGFAPVGDTQPLIRDEEIAALEAALRSRASERRRVIMLGLALAGAVVFSVAVKPPGGNGHKGLDRESAAELVLSSKFMRVNKPVFLGSGKDQGCGWSYPQGADGVYRVAGWVRVDGKGVYATPAFRRGIATTVQKSTSGCRSEEWMIPVARRELIEISGVSQLDNDRAVVEFKWRWVPLNQVGSLLLDREEMQRRLSPSEHQAFYGDTTLFRTGISLMDGKPTTDRIELRLYDDGWRVEE